MHWNHGVKGETFWKFQQVYHEEQFEFSHLNYQFLIRTKRNLNFHAKMNKELEKNEGRVRLPIANSGMSNFH